MAKSKKKNAQVIEIAQTESVQAESLRAVPSGLKFNPWKWLVILAVLFWIGSSVRSCTNNFKQYFANINPFHRFEDLTPPNPFRERKTRPDNEKKENDSDRRGIIWRFTGQTESARTLAGWVKKNVPAGAKPSTIYDVADAFYDAADRIEANPAIDEPNEAVAAARLGIFAAADPSWVPFLSGLDQQANTFGVESIDDVITFYYAVAGALYDAASGVSGAAAPSEAEAGDRVPPTDPGTLPPPAEPAASDTAKDCPDGSCPNRASYYNGYGYGWRWY